MDLVSKRKRVSFLQKILVNRFFCYKNLAIENLWQKSNLIKNLAVKNQNFFTVRFSLGKLHKYYSRLRLLKKNLLKNFFFYFLLNLLQKDLVFFEGKEPFNIFLDKFLFSFNFFILFSKIIDFSNFCFSVILIQKSLINIFLHTKFYFILFYFFVIFFFKKIAKHPTMFIFEFFIDMFLLLLINKKKKKVVFFEKICQNQRKNKLFFLCNEKIFEPVFYSNFSIFFKY